MTDSATARPAHSPLASAVVGLQWGDEGKGKVVDVLTEHADVVARFNGGANAVHSVQFNGKKFATHLLPVGVFREGVRNYLGNGVVIDADQLLKEVDTLTSQGVPVTADNLRVSYKAHLVMPWHKAEDEARETTGEGSSIGTTKRGIGPCYADKAKRVTAVRVADLHDLDRLMPRLDAICEERNAMLNVLGGQRVDLIKVKEHVRNAAEKLGPFVDDVGRLLLDDFAAGRRVVFEGANATMLDIDHGTYPFVTSSTTSSLGIFTGCGIPPKHVGDLIGVLKAYTTRVGGGPMPTELFDEIGSAIREEGREFGTTTGRPRRVGWFDAVAARYAAELSGVTSVALTLLDVLSICDELKICTSYTVGGETMEHFRTDIATLSNAEPVYETLPGWKTDITAARSFDDLPLAAKAYVQRIEQLVGIDVKIIGVGPGREATLTR
ncbi:MAG: adenylosuccinate synthase [Planctomycetota bacterium]